MSLTVESVAAAAAAAETSIRDVVSRTPLRYSPQISAASGASVWFKLENLQLTGSFKIRGASNYLLSLPEDRRRAGCVAASSGNHGAGVACAAEKLGVRSLIFVPEQTSPTKVDAIRSYGGDVRFFGTDGLDTEVHARQYAADNGMPYISPYNDPDIIAGQGSCGVEIVADLPELDAAFVSIGGGGLIAGVGSVLKTHDSEVRVVGCQPAASPVMTKSVESGEIVEMQSQPTLSDGTYGGIEADAITFDLCRAVTDEFVLVDEDAIADAMRRFMDAEHQLIEGAAGVALAAFLQRAGDFSGQHVVILMCGANISRETLARILV